MADVMEERVRSIQSYAGVGFAVGAVVLSLSLAVFPSLPSANQANLIIEAMAKEGLAWWMGLHAAMVLGFVLAAVGFAAFGFLLHLRGASGPASVVTVCALLGASIYVAFLSMEFFLPAFIRNLYSMDPGLATMLFSAVWYWKMGALAVGSVLLFAAVVAAGLGGWGRGVIPAWLGWGGAIFGSIGILVYLFDFWNSTITGAAINPMRMGGVRYGVGLPIQVWMLAVGAILLRERGERASAIPPQARTPVPRRDPVRPAPSGTPFGDAGRPVAPMREQAPRLEPAPMREQAPRLEPAPPRQPAPPREPEPQWESTPQLEPAPRELDGPPSPRERVAHGEPQLPPGTPEPPPLPPPIP
jgi:hypothetical protein